MTQQLIKSCSVAPGGANSRNHVNLDLNNVNSDSLEDGKILLSTL